MSEYTIASESAVTPAADDVIHIYDTSAKATGKVALGELGAGLGQTPVNITATPAVLTVAANANRVHTISVTPVVVTLPASSGSGNTYRFYIKTAATATESTIKVANATDVLKGIVFCATTTSDNAESFITTATSDSLEMNGTTKGGVVGDWYEFTDVSTGFYSVRGFSAPTGTEVTPFDATVS